MHALPELGRQRQEVVWGFLKRCHSRIGENQTLCKNLTKKKMSFIVIEEDI